jgi:hypothetical protein
LKILGITIRHYVPRCDFDETLQALGQAGQMKPLSVRDYPLARMAIGDFGTMQVVGCDSLGHEEMTGAQVLVRVDSLQELAASLQRRGDTVLEGPQSGVEGWTMRVRHREGTVVDYLQVHA